MAGIRIRWRGVARVAAIVAVVLIALSLLPGFLRAPEPPPLGDDVGLPQSVKPTADAAKRRAADRPAAHPRKHRQRSHPHPVPDAPAAKAVIGSRRRDRGAKGRPEVTEPAAPPAPEYTPPPAPEAVAEPLPEPPPAPPSTPDDGSQEFAPH